MSPSVNMHDFGMHVEWNRWSYAIGAPYHNYTYGSSKKLVEQVGKIISKNEWCRDGRVVVKYEK